MSFPALKIGDLVARTPIVQGGMGVGISLSKLASAVANEGGIGVIAGAMVGMREPDVASNPVEANVRALRREIEKARAATKGIIGVNIMVALTTFAEMVRASVEARADVIFSGAGLPMDLPKIFLDACAQKKEEFRTKLVPIVSSGRAATLIAKKWMHKTGLIPDAFVLEGPKAGGHLGFSEEHIFDEAFSLEHLVSGVVDAAKALEDKAGRAIPVIAGGGVFSGADIARNAALDCSGVQMATRFVATDECDADIRFKQAYVDAKEEDVTIIHSPVGMPGRAPEQFLHRGRARRQAKALQVRVPLHQDLRSEHHALLHFLGAHQRHEGQSRQGLRVLRSQRGPREEHRFRSRTRGNPAQGIRRMPCPKGIRRRIIPHFRRSASRSQNDGGTLLLSRKRRLRDGVFLLNGKTSAILHALTESGN